MYKSLIKLLIPVVALSVMFCNEEVKKQISTEKHQVTKIDTVPIYHLKSSVGIPVSGSLSPWKESVLIAEDSSRIISLLVDDKSRVIAGDILLSLWNLKYRSEYTPLDIKAPFSGRVEKVHYKVDDFVSAGSPLIHLKNSDFYILEAGLTSNQYKLT